MDGKLALSIALVFLTSFQTGCQLTQGRIGATRTVSPIAQTPSSNNVMVSGVVKEVKSISVPENGMPLAQVIAHVTVDRPSFRLVEEAAEAAAAAKEAAKEAKEAASEAKAEAKAAEEAAEEAEEEEEAEAAAEEAEAAEEEAEAAEEEAEAAEFAAAEAVSESEKFEDDLWVSVRKRASVQRQMIFLPLSFARFGSGGDVIVATGDVVQILHSSMLPESETTTDPNGPLGNVGSMIIGGLVKSPGRYYPEIEGTLLTEFETKASPVNGWSAVVIERVSPDFGGYEQFIIPKLSGKPYNDFELFNGDVVTYAQTNQIPTLVAGTLRKIQRIRAESTVVSRSNRTVRRNTIAERIGSALPRLR